MNHQQHAALAEHTRRACERHNPSLEQSTMQVNITIDCGNAAFEDSGQSGEIARILRELADRIEVGGAELHVNLYDINGNRVGECRGE